MSIGQSIQTVFNKYAEFRGAAGRSEFWWWILFTSLVSTALNVVPMWSVTLDTWTSTGPSLTGVWGIVILLPTLAVTVRRLRDAGYQWGHIMWLLLPAAGVIILIVLCAQPTRESVAGAGMTRDGAMSGRSPEQGGPGG
jgi:uncharacterized membrane protein YhaH (DUF805 family)